MDVIDINDENRDAVFEIFELALDKEGYVIDRQGERVICRYSKEPIKKDRLAIVAGSEIKINNYSYCISKYITEFLDSK